MCEHITLQSIGVGEAPTISAAAYTGILTTSTAIHTVILGASSATQMGVLRLTIAILTGGGGHLQ